MILVFGSINVDFVSRVAAIARPGETVLTPTYDLFFGGKGANQAVAAARAAGRDGARVMMCGAVGRDELGDDCLRNLKENGVDITQVQIVAERTGSAFISVDQTGENAITVAAGANGKLEAGLLEEALLDVVDVAVLQMEVPLNENLALAKRLRDRKARILLNFAPALSNVPPETLRTLCSNVDYLVLNEVEARSVAGITYPGSEKSDPARALVEAYGLSVVVTSGAAGVKLVCRDGSTWHCAALPVAVVDTTGAGDTFVGIFAEGLSSRLTNEQALQRACWGASLACQAPGAQAGMPSRDELYQPSESSAIAIGGVPPGG